MGHKGLEIAFELRRDKGLVGWLIFQVDMERIKDRYDVDEKELQKFHFDLKGVEKKAG